MSKGTKGQSMIACPSSSQKAHTLEINLITFESTNSWTPVSVVYLVSSNFGFPWCKYDYGISSNTFTCASPYLNGFK